MYLGPSRQSPADDRRVLQRATVVENIESGHRTLAACGPVAARNGQQGRSLNSICCSCRIDWSVSKNQESIHRTWRCSCFPRLYPSSRLFKSRNDRGVSKIDCDSPPHRELGPSPGPGTHTQNLELNLAPSPRRTCLCVITAALASTRRASSPLSCPLSGGTKLFFLSSGNENFPPLLCGEQGGQQQVTRRWARGRCRAERPTEVSGSGERRQRPGEAPQE